MSTDQRKTTVDNHYSNRKLASLYDITCGWSEDRDFYLSLAGDNTLDILELGCGTGLLSRAYASKGHRVVGVDPAASMLEIAGDRSSLHNIEWVEAYAQTYRPSRQFDLVVMTGHAFQVLLKKHDVLNLFSNVRSYLKPSGMFVFESRNPAIDWAVKWDKKSERYESDYGTFNMSVDILQYDSRTISFRQNFEFTNETLDSTSTLRFMQYEELLTCFSETSLSINNIYGDWSKSSFNAMTSLEMIFVVSVGNHDNQ